MKSRIQNFVAEAFVWTLLATYVEVSVTATVERLSLGDRYVLSGVPFASLQGHTTSWQIIVGVLCTLGVRGFLRFLGRVEQRESVFHRWWARALLAMVAIYVSEFLAGLLFNKALGWRLWDYSQYVWHGIPLHLQGQITLVYAPAWFLAGAMVRPVYRAVHTLAPYVGEDALAFVHDALGAVPTKA